MVNNIVRTNKYVHTFSVSIFFLVSLLVYEKLEPSEIISL